MRRFRHLFLLRFVLVVLLAWTAADLLVPELCAAESTTATSVPQADDCFCCSQTVETVTVEWDMIPGASLPIVDAPMPSLSPGVPRELFHPPLSL